MSAQDNVQHVKMTYAYVFERLAVLLGDEEEVEFFNMVFRALEMYLAEAWNDEKNFLVTIGDFDEESDIVDESTGEKVKGVIKEYSRYSLAFLDGIIFQFDRVQTQIMKNVAKKYENLPDKLIDAFTPVQNILQWEQESPQITFKSLQLRDEQTFTPYKLGYDLYCGNKQAIDSKDQDLSSLNELIIFWFPHFLFVADYFHVLNKRRIYYSKAKDVFDETLQNTIQLHKETIVLAFQQFNQSVLNVENEMKLYVQNLKRVDVLLDQL